MESVPETERMEFQPSRLRMHATNLAPPELDLSRKSLAVRRSAEPSPASSPTSPSWPLAALPYRPGAASPLSGGGSSHGRSKSAAGLAPPLMTRTQSMPGVNAAGHLLLRPQSPSQLRPHSPSGSLGRVRVPRKPVDEAFPSSPTRVSIHDPEKLAERNTSPNLALANITASRMRRPSSPLRHVAHASIGSLPAYPTTPTSIASSPSYRSYDSLTSNYAFPSAYPSSSVPSTPTSTRSRSPSISSLETIPDSPDAEEAALEAERIAQLKAAAEAADGGEVKARNSLDVPTRGRTMSFGSRDKRKRWSVCGAERRQDLDLETIWEV